MTHHGVFRHDVAIQGGVVFAHLLHLDGASDKLTDVDACHGDGQQSHRGEHRETATHVIGDDIGLVTLHISQLLQGALGLVGDGHDARSGLLLTVFINDMLFQDAEGDGRLRGGTRLRNHRQRIVLLIEDGHQLMEIVLAHVVPGIND